MNLSVMKTREAVALNEITADHPIHARNDECVKECMR